MVCVNETDRSIVTIPYIAEPAESYKPPGSRVIMEYKYHTLLISLKVFINYGLENVRGFFYYKHLSPPPPLPPTLRMHSLNKNSYMWERNEANPLLYA